MATAARGRGWRTMKNRKTNPLSSAKDYLRFPYSTGPEAFVGAGERRAWKDGSCFGIVGWNGPLIPEFPVLWFDDIENMVKPASSVVTR